MKRISKACLAVDFLLTTEKDAVKLHGVDFPKPCLIVPLDLEFENVEVLEKSLDSMLKGYDKSLKLKTC